MMKKLTRCNLGIASSSSLKLGLLAMTSLRGPKGRSNLLNGLFLVAFLFSVDCGLWTVDSFAEPVYIDHFEKVVNMLGGRTSIYEMAPSKALAVTTEKEFYGPAGRSLALRYDKRNAGGPQNEGGWCGYYTLLKVGGKYFDSTPYKKLIFWVKGASGGENFKVGVADKHWEGVGDSVKSEEVIKYLKDQKITTEWQQASIPLDDFFVELKELASLSICFEGDCFPEGSGSGKGTVYIDELAFE